MNKTLTQYALALVGASLMTQSALAESHSRAVALLPAYQQECSSCHLAFPPGMLPAASWSRLLGNLPKHFGVDASLDAATLKTISTWVAANAGTHRRVSEEPAQDRITRSAWFVRQHDEVRSATWKLPTVKSAAHCAACHTTAEQGDFNEHKVRIPR